jgi:hypothetical protein
LYQFLPAGRLGAVHDHGQKWAVFDSNWPRS